VLIEPIIYVVYRKEKLRRATPKATACYVAQSSGTSAANIIDCTREREDKRACDEGKRKIEIHVYREREKEEARERACEGWHEPL